MKISALLLIIACLQVSAAALSQQISLTVKNQPLEKVIRTLQKKSGYRFIYNNELLSKARPVSINIENGTIGQILESAFRDQPLTYSMLEGTIVVKPRPERVPPVSRPVLPPPAAPVTEQELRGKVTDEKGEGLPGVNILIKGTRQGTSTAGDGTFSLVVPDEEAVLVFSFVGYLSQEVSVGKRTELDVRMQVDEKSLEEVVVVAYGTQKKATVTGAIASVSTREIKQSPAANLAVTLAGRLPGLTTLQRSGEPGRDATLLYLRGRGTLNGQNPIILVDGVERDLTYIDPNEVENVTILKDASSTALFGVRGANGVILVTTKRGQNEKPRITFTAEYGSQDFTREPGMVSSYDWARLRNEAWRNDNPDLDPTNPSNQPPYSDYALERFRKGDFREVYPDNNWQKLLLHDRVGQNRYNLNITGGGDFVRYFVNVGVLNQGGQWKVAKDLEYNPEAFLKRYNFRSNIDAVLNRSQTLRTFLNVAGYMEKVNSPNVDASEIFRRIYSLFPVVQPGPLTPDGEVLIGQGLYNESPWAYINRSGYRQETRSNVMASWGLEQDLGFLTKGLSTKFMASFDTRTIYNLTASKTWQRWIQMVVPDQETGRDSVFYQRVLSNVENTPLSTSTSALFQSFFNFQWFLNYNRTFNEKHQVGGLVLAQQEGRIKPNDRLPFNLRGISTRLSYGYDNKYYVEFNAGFNGSEQFAKGNRYGFFPSLSAGWVASNEAFLKNNRVVTHLKLRGSYGKVGSDQLGGRRFLYLDDIQRSGGGYSPTLGNGEFVQENFLGNPWVKWEVAEKSNLGLELGLFEKLSFSADFFHESRDNVLINRNTIPVLNGIGLGSLPPVNMGIVKNRGYELELNYNAVLAKDLSFLAKLNFNHAKNKLVFADEPKLAEDYAYRYRATGYAIGQYFGYKTEGYYNSRAEIDADGLTYVGRGPRPGDFRYADLNKDGIIDERDMTPIGYTSVPEYTFGAAFTINYKNFDFSVLAQGVSHVSDNLSGNGVYSLYDFRQRHLHGWTAERAASGQRIDYPALSLAESSSERANSFFIENRSFVRLKNLEIGYRLPSEVSKKIAASEIRIYVNGLNLFTWDKMKTRDYDPEVSNSTSYPVYRVVNAGINVAF